VFGLVAERVVLSLPGDDHVVVYRARDDALDRFPWQETAAARLGLWGDVETLQALALGIVPWPEGHPPADLERRVVERGSVTTIRLQTEGGPGDLGLDVRAGRLHRLTWRMEGAAETLEVRYDRYRPDLPHPMRVRLRAGAVEAEIEWDQLEVPARFEPGDFEIGIRNPAPEPGVSRG
jgi:hypothetical protein